MTFKAGDFVLAQSEHLGRQSCVGVLENNKDPFSNFVFRANMACVGCGFRGQHTSYLVVNSELTLVWRP